MTSRLLLEGLMDSMRDAHAVGDVAGAQMLDDIIDGYLGGWVADSNARAALFASERRIRKNKRTTAGATVTRKADSRQRASLTAEQCRLADGSGVAHTG